MIKNILIKCFLYVYMLYFYMLLYVSIQHESIKSKLLSLLQSMILQQAHRDASASQNKSVKHMPQKPGEVKNIRIQYTEAVVLKTQNEEIHKK